MKTHLPTFTARATYPDLHWAHQEGQVDGRGWTSGPARYAKKSVSVRFERVDGYKGRGQYLMEAVNARFSNRERAYILSEAAFRRWGKLAHTGRDANIFGELIPLEAAAA